MRQDRWVVVALVVVGLLVPACREASSGGASYEEPAAVEPIEGTDRVRVILTEQAAERIDLQTASVESAGNGTQTVIPHAAVFYGLAGETWTYTSPEPLTFVREPITVDHIDGDLAYLSDGPPVGTEVVTVGAAELFGVETEVGK
ncbi:MAG TPA: hypothetical protein VGL18_10085 [Actinomycetota bacterium]|jgi:hypothetical protein